MTPEEFVKKAHEKFGDEMLVFDEDEDCISFIRETPIENPEDHFKSSVIAETPGGNQYVVITEDCKYKGWVFFIDHEEDMYGLNMIDAWLDSDFQNASGVSREEYEKMTPEERISHMPFMEWGKRASSLEDFFKYMQLESEREEQ